MERIQFIEHKGKKILFVDYSGLKTEELALHIEAARKQIKSHAPGTALVLSDHENMRFNASSISQFKELISDCDSYIKGSSVIGIRGLQRIAFDAVNKLSKSKIASFDSKEEALDYLAGI